MLALHIAVAAFVVGGLVIAWFGNWMRWTWVNNLWFRLAHVVAIGVIVAEAALGVMCPLTTLEMWLRARTGTVVYAGGFVEHWLQTLLYYDAPAWVFTLAYAAFGLAVLATWWYFPPTLKRDTVEPGGQRCR